MSVAPARNEISDVYPNPTNATARTGMGKLWDWLTGSLGQDGNAYGFARQNLLTNPNWQIDQINEGALYTITGGGADVQTVDGWSGSAPVAPGVFKVRRLADPDNAALKCLEITCTTIDAAIAAADAYYLHTAIEGQDAAGLMIGTALAKQITINFNFKTNVTGVYGVSVGNSALNRSYVGVITVADALEHSYSVTLTLDTTGTWLYDTGVGLRMRLCLAAGSNFQKAAGAWGADNMLSNSSQCNFMSNAANTAYLKGIQLVQGSVALPLATPDILKDLDKCQRYYAKTFNQGVAVAQNSGSALGAFIISHPIAAAVVSSLSWRYPKPMRIAPTITAYNPAAANALFRNLTGGADSGAASFTETGTDGSTVSNAGAAGDAANSRAGVHLSANARLT